jgi:hypothetical protein
MGGEKATYQHPNARSAGSFPALNALSERAHTSLLPLVHVSCFTQQNPGLVAAFTQLPLLNSSFQQ